MDERKGDEWIESAEARLFASSARAGLRPLIAGAHAVYTLHLQLANVLEERGGGAQLAAFFAEPHEGRTEIDWYSQLLGPVVRWLDAPARERAASQPALRARVAEVAGLIEELRRAGQDQIAAILEASLTVPGEQHIYLIGGEPVLTCWGFLPDVEPPLGLDLLAAHAGRGPAGPLAGAAPAAPKHDAPVEMATVMIPVARVRERAAALVPRVDPVPVVTPLPATRPPAAAVPPATPQIVPPAAPVAPRMVPPASPPPARRPVVVPSPPAAPLATPRAAPSPAPQPPRYDDMRTSLSPVVPTAPPAYAPPSAPEPPEPEARRGPWLMLVIGVPFLLLLGVLLLVFLFFVAAALA